MAILRPILEEGIVVSKVHKDAMESFKSSSGEVVPAQPEKFVVKVISSYECTPDKGMSDPTILDYKVEKELFDKLKFGTKVRVKFNMSSASEKPKADSIVAILDNRTNGLN